MWELDNKQGWEPKNLCLWTVVLEKTLESPLDSKENKPVNPKGNQLWIFNGRSDAEVEASILWPPDAKSWLIGKEPDAGKDWVQAEKAVREGEMVRGHHWLNGHESEQAQGDGEGQETWCSPAVHGVTKSQTQHSNWTTTTMPVCVFDLPCHLQSLQKWLPSIDDLTKVIQGLSWCFIATLWNRAGTYSPSPMSSACLLSVKNCTQRISLIREMRTCRNKGKQRRPNNVVIKHSQGPLVSSQGL